MKRQFGFAFLSHLVILLTVYASPFLFPWKIIAACFLLYYVQLLIIGNCFLTVWQFGPGESYNAHYLAKAGIRIPSARLEVVLNYVIPAVVLSVALVWQIMLDKPTTL